jgi:hypothetical protein
MTELYYHYYKRKNGMTAYHRKRISLVGLISILFVTMSCSHVSPIREAPLIHDIEAFKPSGIGKLKVEVHLRNPGNEKLENLAESIKLAFEDKLKRVGGNIDENSPKLINLNVTRFNIFGDGLILCQSHFDINARLLIDNKEVASKNFSASGQGYFCSFGDSNKRMKKANEAAFTKIVHNILNWVAIQNK